jgi:hypothetical protein
VGEGGQPLRSLKAFLAMMFFWISVAPAPIEV